MRAFKVSKDSKLTIEEKLQALEEYDVSDLLYVLREFEDNPRSYEKEIMIAVINRLFENGITCL